MTDALARLSSAQQLSIARAMTLGSPSASERELANARVDALEKALLAQQAAHDAQMAALTAALVQQANHVGNLAEQVAALLKVQQSAAKALTRLADRPIVAESVARVPDAVILDGRTYTAEALLNSKGLTAGVFDIYNHHKDKNNPVSLLRACAYLVEQRHLTGGVLYHPKQTMEICRTSQHSYRAVRRRLPYFCDWQPHAK